MVNASPHGTFLSPSHWLCSLAGEEKKHFCGPLLLFLSGKTQRQGLVCSRYSRRKFAGFLDRKSWISEIISDNV